MKELWKKIKNRIPVSRGRYERELSLLRLSVNRSIMEEKNQLESMINSLHYITIYPNNGVREITVSMRMSDKLLYSCRSPYHRNRLFFEIATNISKSLEKEMGK